MRKYAQHIFPRLNINNAYKRWNEKATKILAKIKKDTRLIVVIAKKSGMQGRLSLPFKMPGTHLAPHPACLGGGAGRPWVAAPMGTAAR